MGATSGCVKEIGRAVGLRQRMVEVKLLCFKWLSPFLKLVKKGFPRPFSGFECHLTADVT